MYKIPFLSRLRVSFFHTSERGNLQTQRKAFCRPNRRVEASRYILYFLHYILQSSCTGGVSTLMYLTRYCNSRKQCCSINISKSALIIDLLEALRLAVSCRHILANPKLQPVRSEPFANRHIPPLLRTERERRLFEPPGKGSSTTCLNIMACLLKNGKQLFLTLN